MTVSKQKQLLDWPKLSFLNKMLDDGVSPNKCARWCKENGFSISVPTMYEYAKNRRAKIINTIQADKLRPNKSNKKHRANNPTNEERKQAHMTVDKVKSDLELLDAVIQQGFETLSNMEKINPATAIKAIELKHKLTGGATGGYTVYGLEEIRLREAARENAIVTIMMKYIPPEKHSEVLTEMEDATREYYRSIGLEEAYAQLEA